MGALFTPTEDAELIRLVGLGFSYTQCIGLMVEAGFPKRTRNSLIGRGMRIGLRVERPRHAASIDAATERRLREPRAARVPAAQPVVAKPAAPKVAKVTPAPAPAPRPISPAAVPAVPAADRPGLPFLSLRAGDGRCRNPLWPDEGHTPLEVKAVCGERVEGTGPYCAACYPGKHAPREGAPLLRQAASFRRHDGSRAERPPRERDVLDQMQGVA